MDRRETSGGRRTVIVRAPRDLVAGLILLALSVILLIALGRVHTVHFQSISPTLFPRMCAIALAVCSMVLLIRAFIRNGPGVEPTLLRGLLFIPLSVVVFGLLTPMVGYAVAGFLTVVIGGFATAEVRPRELLITAVGLIVLCLALFTYGLGLTTPAFKLPGFLG
jgi:hypothetical protein